VGSFAFSERRLMRRLDTGATPASGSGDTLRFLFSGTSVAIVIVLGKGKRVSEARSSLVPGTSPLNWRSFEACQLRFEQADRTGPDRVMHGLADWQFLSSLLLGVI
jgi:hypothetical protein